MSRNPKNFGPFQRVPVISREALAELLVPKYLAEVPEKDGWGHPYEYRLQTGDLDPVVGSVHGLDDPGETIRVMAERRAVGKVILRLR